MGLLDNALQALKSQYEETKGNVGLLVSDPKRYMSGLNQDAAEYNRLSSLALQAERNAYRGIPVSQEQAAAKQYIDQKQMDMALGFTGSIKPTNITFDEFKNLASKGKLNLAKTKEQELNDLYSGKSKFAEVNLNWEDPKTYDFEEKLLSKGYKTKVAKNGSTLIFKDSKDISAIESAKTPAEYGQAYGYHPNDIARFYWERRNSNLSPDAANLAYKEWLKDSLK